MDQDFREKLDGIIAQFESPIWDRVRADSNRVLATGVENIADLMALVADESQDVKIRVLAVWLLERIGDERVISMLVTLLESQHMPLRIQAAIALGHMRVRHAIASLTGMMTGDTDPTVRKIAAYALGEIGDKHTLPVLLNVLGNQQEDAMVRGQVAEALAYFCGEGDSIIPILLKTLYDEEPEVRFWSAYALGYVGDESAIPGLEKIASLDHVQVPQWGMVSEEAISAIEVIRSRIDNS